MLRRAHETGTLSGAATDADFAAAVTTVLQSVNDDRHLRLLHSVEEIPLTEDGASDPLDTSSYRQEVRLCAGGIASAQRLDGNVGYLDVRVLHDANIAAPLASAAMTFVAGTDTLLIDLRRCPGGSPLMVAHYCSYLFDDPTHLTDVYDRPSDQTRQFWTAPWVPGEKLGEAKPIYVLVGPATLLRGGAVRLRAAEPGAGHHRGRADPRRRPPRCPASDRPTSCALRTAGAHDQSGHGHGLGRQRSAARRRRHRRRGLRYRVRAGSRAHPDSGSGRGPALGQRRGRGSSDQPARSQPMTAARQDVA